MAAYNGRRGPNVSQFLQNLNTISPQDTTGDDNFTEDALALFTTGEFFDLDSGQSTNFHSQTVENVKPVAEDVTSATPTMNNVPNLDFGESRFFCLFLFLLHSLSLSLSPSSCSYHFRYVVQRLSTLFICSTRARPRFPGRLSLQRGGQSANETYIPPASLVLSGPLFAYPPAGSLPMHRSLFPWRSAALIGGHGRPSAATTVKARVVWGLLHSTAGLQIGAMAQFLVISS
jgi:hypothetical protein